MGLTVQQYEDTPALTADWDLAIHRVQTRVEDEREAARLKALTGGGGAA